MKIVKGDLLTSPTQYIAHQCNCITSNAAHLSKAVFEAFPEADIYSPRLGKTVPRPDEQPGDIKVKNKVINILGQLYPGKSKNHNDGPKERQAFFQQALDKIREIPNLESIAFPEGIGCGAAGGHWPDYLKMIEEFDKQTDAEVVVLSPPRKCLGCGKEDQTTLIRETDEPYCDRCWKE